MSDRRKHREGCGADESMYVHSEHRRHFQSQPFQRDSTGFTLLPPRPGTSSRNSGPLGLQVQGFCCPLRQRPSSGRVTPQSRGGGDGSLTLLSSLSGRMESRAEPESRSRTGSRPEMTPQTVIHCTGPVSKAAETPTTLCDNERPARRGQPGVTMVSELHLYLPSPLCEDGAQSAEAE